jgi:hypothetical protein
MNSLPKLAARPHGVTVADVMRIRCGTMREAVGLLRAAEAAGKIRRTGGGRGEAFRWVSP